MNITKILITPKSLIVSSITDDEKDEKMNGDKYNNSDTHCMIKIPKSDRSDQNHRFSSTNLFRSNLANFLDIMINIIPDISKQRASKATVMK